MYEPEFDLIVEELPADTDNAVHKLLSEYDRYMNDDSRIDEEDHYGILFRFYTILYSILDNEQEQSFAFENSHNLRDSMGYPIISTLNFDEEIGNIVSFIVERFKEVKRTKLKRLSERDFKSSVRRTKAKISKAPAYHFNDQEITEIQRLINELRIYLTDSDLFEDAHRRRLLQRLEGLQVELHKKMSDLDRFWGLLGDAGVALGKFGTDAKPIVDRIRELTGIIWKAQARAEGIESSGGPPLLTGPERS
ncbi:MAG: hypothetical protein WAS21_03795 [Geminicoccaceae bacterium]